MEIHCLGNSGTGVTRDLVTCSYVIDKAIAIDTCENFTQKLLQYGSSKVSVICLTHTHADHIIGLFMYIWRSYLYERDEKSPLILIPAPHGQDLWDLFRLFCVPGLEDNRQYFQIQEIDPFSKESYKFTTENGEHYSIRWQKVAHKENTVAYSVEGPSTKSKTARVVFSADTRYHEPLIELTQGADLLIHEATFLDTETEKLQTIRHSCPSDAAKIAKQGNIKWLLLTHLPKAMTEEHLTGAKKIFPNMELIEQDKSYTI